MYDNEDDDDMIKYLMMMMMKSPETFVLLAMLLCETGHGRASPYLIIGMLMLMLMLMLYDWYSWLR